MRKQCFKHQCLNKKDCPDKIFLGNLALCKKDDVQCANCDKNPFGKYEPEDIILV